MAVDCSRCVSEECNANCEGDKNARSGKGGVCLGGNGTVPLTRRNQTTSDRRGSSHGSSVDGSQAQGPRPKAPKAPRGPKSQSPTPTKSRRPMCTSATSNKLSSLRNLRRRECERDGGDPQRISPQNEIISPNFTTASLQLQHIKITH